MNSTCLLNRFSVLTRQGVTDISMIAMPTISGIKMSVGYLRSV